ncbi:MAG: hypothetical protein V1850_06245 [Candidatus Bathyarchaeota archaeon]
MSMAENLKVSMFEARTVNLDLVDKSYDAASNLLRRHGLMVLYECGMNVLNEVQRGLYSKVISKVPREIVLFLDPIVLSFALRDACDLSGVDYMWLDLEGEDDVGCSAWVNEKDSNAVISLAIDLLKRHLEKYLIDAYDHGTREDMMRVWDAGLGLQACPICGEASPERRVIAANEHKFRGWTCKSCNYHVILPSDSLDYFGDKVEGSG